MAKISIKKMNFGFLKAFKSKKVIAIVLIIAIIASFFIYNSFFKKKSDDKTTQTATASIGNVSKIIEGSGTIEAIDQYEVTALSIKGEVLESNFEEGDTVKKGQVLYKIDSSDMERSITSSKSQLEKAQSSYDDTLDNYSETMENESVNALSSGVITSLSVEDGDKVNAGSVVAVVKNSDEMILKINFNSDDAKNIYVGDSATITLETSFSTINGTVSRVGTGDMTTNEGAKVRAIEIIVKNPGAIKDGDKATAIVGNFACNSEGAFSYSEDKTISAKVSGDVYNLNFKQGDKVEKGDLLFNIDSNYKTSTLTNSSLSLNDAKNNLDKLYDDLDEYTITAPIDGEIIQKNIKQGEKIDNSNSNSALAIIADLSTLVFDMSIDELDISNIDVGQEVQITADAFDDVTFTGYVDKISIVGESVQGVTSYPVTVIIDSDENELLIPGMNVSASIIIEERENVLTLPVSAIRRGNVVIAKTDSKGVEMPNMKSETLATTINSDNDSDNISDNATKKPFGKPSEGNGANNGDMQKFAGKMRQSSDDNAQASKSTDKIANKATNNSENNEIDSEDNPYFKNLEIPSGYKAIFVEIGLSDDKYIEITDGLNEGDVVILPDSTLPSSTNMFGMPTNMGSMGGSPMSGSSGGSGRQSKTR